MSENSFSSSVTPTSIALALFLLFLGAVIGLMVDRRKFKYQTKSGAKTELLSSMYQFVGAFPTLEKTFKNNTVSDEQWGQLRHFADLINQANSTVKALGVESENQKEIQELITKMELLGNKMLNSRQVIDYIPHHIRENYVQSLNDMANEGVVIQVCIKNLADKLQIEFNKKKYLIF